MRTELERILGIARDIYGDSDSSFTRDQAETIELLAARVLEQFEEQSDNARSAADLVGALNADIQKLRDLADELDTNVQKLREEIKSLYWG